MRGKKDKSFSMEEVVSVLVKVGNYTNVQVSIAHNMWQVPVRSEGLFLFFCF
jgi:hypothetical protein